MGIWTDIRDSAEAAASVAGNYFVPGSGLITSQLVSSGARDKLNSGVGQIAMLGSGLTGAGVGSDITGIPASGGYSGLSSFFNGAGPETTSTGTGLTGDASSMTNTPTTGTTDYTAGANYGAPAAPGGQGLQMTQGSNLPSTVGSSSPGFLSSLMSGNFGDAAGAAGKAIGNNPIPSIYAAGSLYDMYAKNQMAKQQQQRFQDVQNQINGMYAPGSAEYNALWNQMSAADAAAGRNSQYGTRSTDLAAKIAGIKSQMLSNTLGNQNTMFNSGLGNQYGMFNTPMTLAALTATQKGQ